MTSSRLSAVACAVLATASVAACGVPPPPAKPLLRVGVEAAKKIDHAPDVVLTGEVAARVSSDLSFQVGGRVVERKAEVGDRVTADQVLAILDPDEQKANVAAAEADVRAAEAKLRQATSTFERQKTLIGQGFTTRREFDQADQDVKTSRAALDGARAQLGSARDQLDKTFLRAGHPGVITARSVEAGQVVQSAQTVYSLAQDGPRDAVFYVYESIFIREPANRAIEIALLADPSVRARAEAREIAPVVDPSGGTVRVKFDIADPPAAMTLGAAVTGTGRFRSQKLVVLPWRVLSSRDGSPAVWLVDRATKRVSLQPIAIQTYELGRVVVRAGVDQDQLVVVEGQQLLRPGQVVEPVEIGPS